MNWELVFLPEAEKDLKELDHSQQVVTRAAINRVSTNPLPQSEGGYGKPLGHKGGKNLTNFFKIKLKREGIRVVYRLMRDETRMLVVVVGVREDEEVYDIALRRKDRLNKMGHKGKENE